ncbi:thymidylate kinase [Candidatus Nitrososphaera evergladensis SR1]|uniref:Probable thymidylate kinase n=1 Tax=Candidatus Nitrososphaera evergladensis SR1 TaxID=1459636 RepID=A0A075ML26_9ARCH|nr:dTMP kinase [Candidatus Nitrososphaera evergladensis]AIF82136.1 thymidylate kinase [Candidatus Nitrososphaera evergladensis SR1]
MRRGRAVAAAAERTLQFYGHGIPYIEDTGIKGRLIVIEGPDASGRSTQIGLITAKLEAAGHAVLNTGLKRSELISEGILEAKRNFAGRKTLSLFYAADFADQLENKIIPALRAGYVVLADRYIYTLLAREAVRGISRRWSHNLFSFAIVPDLVFYLDVEPEELVHRVFQKNAYLDYYESGADMGLANDMFESFMKYQAMIAKEFRRMQKRYNLVIIDGNRSIPEINADLQKRIDAFLESAHAASSKATL